MTEERRNSAQLLRNFSRKPVSTSCRPGLPLSTAQTASTVRLLRLPHVTSSHAHASIHCPLDTCRRPLIQAQSFGGNRQASHYTPTWTWPRRARQRPDESNRHVALVASRPEGKGTGVRLQVATAPSPNWRDAGRRPATYASGFRPSPPLPPPDSDACSATTGEEASCRHKPGAVHAPSSWLRTCGWLESGDQTRYSTTTDLEKS